MDMIDFIESLNYRVLDSKTSSVQSLFNHQLDSLAPIDVYTCIQPPPHDELANNRLPVQYSDSVWT